MNATKSLDFFYLVLGKRDETDRKHTWHWKQSYNFMQIKPRPTRCNKWWFNGNQLFLNMFRASLRPSSGEQTACDWLWFPVLAMVVVATSSAQCTHLATRLSGTTTTIATIGNHSQWHAVCCPDDGHKDARNMLRNNWLPINHHLLHLVGPAFICSSKMHGQSIIKFTILCWAVSPRRPHRLWSSRIFLLIGYRG
jgi:hypothetical protein